MTIELLEFVTNKVKCGKKLKEYPLYAKIDNSYIMLSYNLITGNGAKREYSLTIPIYINRTKETFEVLGLLQAEMGKTDNGCITFANCEHRLINKVMGWFEKEFELTHSKWRWYIKLNINEPEDKNYRKEVENKVIDYWLSKTKIDSDKRHPKTVSYIKNTNNKKLKPKDYGTLIIENKSNLLSQIIKRYVKIMSNRMPSLEKDEIRGFMTGILAGESCVENAKKMKKYRVHLTANNKSERDLYQNCLSKLGICIVQYEDYKEMIISKRKNNVELLKQKLMCLSPQKYNRFLNMMQLYPKISEETGYFTKNKKPHNKMTQEKINRILKACCQNPDLPCWKIAKEENVSTISIARIRKKHNLGKRLIRTPKDVIERVIELHNNKPSAYAYEIAEQLGLHRARVERIRRKYNLRRQKPYR